MTYYVIPTWALGQIGDQCTNAGDAIEQALRKGQDTTVLLVIGEATNKSGVTWKEASKDDNE